MAVNGKKIAGITRIADFPFNPVLAIKLSYLCDYLVLGFDAQGGYGKTDGTDYVDGITWYNLFRKINPFPKSCTVDMFLTKTYANAKIANDWSTSYLEELLRRLDNIRPDYVIECEADACFSDEFENELKSFIEGDYDTWMMDAINVSDDNRFVAEGTWCEHQRVHKWWDGITYHSGLGFCITKHNGFPNAPKMFRGKTLMWHFPLFTERFEKERMDRYSEGTYKYQLKHSMKLYNSNIYYGYSRKYKEHLHFKLISCEIDPSNRCQNNCEFCYFKDRRDLSDMTLEHFDRISDELKDAGVQTITFTGGGEPTVNDSFNDMALMAIKKGFRIGLITNGIMLNKVLPIANYFKFIRISLDAATKETYHSLKGTDFFDTVINNIKSIADKTDVGISFVICDKNKQETEQAKLIARECGVKYIQFKPDNRNSSLIFDIPDAINTKRFKPDSNSPCKVANQTGIVNPKGEVFYCCQKRNIDQYKLGTMLNGKTFKQIWDERDSINPDISTCDTCRYMNYLIDDNPIQHYGFV